MQAEAALVQPKQRMDANRSSVDAAEALRPGGGCTHNISMDQQRFHRERSGRLHPGQEACPELLRLITTPVLSPDPDTWARLWQEEFTGVHTGIAASIPQRLQGGHDVVYIPDRTAWLGQNCRNGKQTANIFQEQHSRSAVAHVLQTTCHRGSACVQRVVCILMPQAAPLCIHPRQTPAAAAENQEVHLRDAAGQLVDVSVDVQSRCKIAGTKIAHSRVDLRAELLLAMHLWAVGPVQIPDSLYNARHEGSDKICTAAQRPEANRVASSRSN